MDNGEEENDGGRYWRRGERRSEDSFWEREREEAKIMRKNIDKKRDRE